LNVLLQVKIDRGVNKSGIEPEEALPLAKEVLRLKGLRLRGIMTMPDPSPTVLEELAVHRLARTLFEQLQNDLGLSSQEGWDTLSMGMSQDMDSAIQAGSTMVRVGSAIFGARPKAQPA
jgi:pyridoxal phosphate enzyme (YggS family)